MRVREATSDDWPAISDISTRSGYMDYINRLGPSYMENSTILIAEDESIMGFSKIERLPDGSSWLSGLRVAPEHWRKGVGSTLTKEAAEFARSSGSRAARMLVEESNYRSRALSDKLGFRVAREYFFFEGGLDLEGYSVSGPETGSYLATGWSFIKGDSVEVPGTFYSSGKNTVFVGGEKRRSFHILSAGEPFRHEGDGITLCPVDLMGDSMSGLRRMEDFPKGFLYEMVF